MQLAEHIRNGKLAVRVKPNAKETKIQGYDDGRKAVLIDVAAPPEDDKANVELLKFLKRELGKPVLLHSGATSREKIISVP